MKVLVIIVTYNGMKWLPKVLGSVSGYDVMVVDNGSSDGSADWIRASCPDVLLMESKENLGFGKANNLGFRHAVGNGYDYVYLLNQDAWVFPDTIPALVAAAEADKTFGIISPMQMTAGLDKLDWNFRRKCGKYLEAAGDLVPVRFVMAAHWLIPVRVLKVVGAFSPAFPHYSEDNNYIHRARYHGFQVGVLKTVKAVHDREKRPDTKEKHMWRKFMTAVAGMVNPNRSFAFQAVIQPLSMILFCFRYLTLLPLKYMLRLVKGMPDYKDLRRQSMSEGAFLDD